MEEGRYASRDGQSRWVTAYAMGEARSFGRRRAATRARVAVHLEGERCRRPLYCAERVQAESVTDIYIMNADGSGLRRVVSRLGVSGSPASTEDGGALLYCLQTACGGAAPGDGAARITISLTSPRVEIRYVLPAPKPLPPSAATLRPLGGRWTGIVGWRRKHGGAWPLPPAASGLGHATAGSRDLP